MAQKSSHCWPVPTPTPIIPSLAIPTPGLTTDRFDRNGRPSAST
jgi:hypothetical protein